MIRNGKSRPDLMTVSSAVPREVWKMARIRVAEDETTLSAVLNSLLTSYAKKTTNEYVGIPPKTSK